MTGGAPPEVEIMCARQNVIGHFNRLTHKANDVTDESWREFFAGAMWAFNGMMDGYLDGFNVEVKDD